MGLRLYADAACTQEITIDNPDLIHKAVVSGGDMMDDRSLWIKSDDPSLTYEHISLSAQDVSEALTVRYAPDAGGVPGGYVDVLSLSNGPFEAAVRVWRRVVAPNVTAAFNTEVRHVLSWDEFVR